MPTPKKDSSINILPVILPNLRKEFCKLFAELLNHWSWEHRCCSHVSVHCILTAKLDPTGSPLLYTLDGQWSQYLGEISGRNYGGTWSTHKCSCSSFFRIDISSTLIHLENKRWIMINMTINNVLQNDNTCTESKTHGQDISLTWHVDLLLLPGKRININMISIHLFLLNMNENKRCFEVVFSSAKFSSHTSLWPKTLTELNVMLLSRSCDQ